MRRIFLSAITITVLATACKKEDPIETNSNSSNLDDNTELVNKLKSYAPQAQIQTKNSDKIIKTVKKSGSRVVDKLSPMHYINKGKILTKKGTVIDLFTKTGKVNPTALSSINRKGGHKLFKDKIVFDLI